jgi:antibiotic biosynthesis monooxygenase (ABM) superfamily enzyme
MVRMFVRHEVADYEKWRKAYDDFGKERGGMGVTGDAVYRSVVNANDVTVTHDFENLEKAKAFMESPRLREAMEAAGVTSQPSAWFTNPA